MLFAGWPTGLLLAFFMERVQIIGLEFWGQKEQTTQHYIKFYCFVLQISRYLSVFISHRNTFRFIWCESRWCKEFRLWFDTWRKNWYISKFGEWMIVRFRFGVWKSKTIPLIHSFRHTFIIDVCSAAVQTMKTDSRPSLFPGNIVIDGESSLDFKNSQLAHCDSLFRSIQENHEEKSI